MASTVHHPHHPDRACWRGRLAAPGLSGTGRRAGAASCPPSPSPAAAAQQCRHRRLRRRAAVPVAVLGHRHHHRPRSVTPASPASATSPGWTPALTDAYNAPATGARWRCAASRWTTAVQLPPRRPADQRRDRAAHWQQGGARTAQGHQRHPGRHERPGGLVNLSRQAAGGALRQADRWTRARHACLAVRPGDRVGDGRPAGLAPQRRVRQHLTRRRRQRGPPLPSGGAWRSTGEPPRHADRGRGRDSAARRQPSTPGFSLLGRPLPDRRDDRPAHEPQQPALEPAGGDSTGDTGSMR
jgi:hypothetical protein